MEADPSYSRPLATAARLGDNAPDLHRFLNKQVLLTGEETVLATANGRECILDALRMLVRICRNVMVWLPSECASLKSECMTEADRIAFGTPVSFPQDVPDHAVYDAVLCIGFVARPEFPWTVVNSNGWLARVSSGTTSLPPETEQYNPIAALAAASLGVADVFKRLLSVPVIRAPLFDGLSFSLLTYSSGETDAGPPLPTTLLLDLLVVGIGAIGNGVVHLLDTLPVSGRAWVVDPQTFQRENLGTCLLIGLADLERQKAAVAEAILRRQLQAKGFSEKLADFKTRLGKEIPYPKMVLNGLDNIQARQEVQDLWPDLIIDGAIGDFGCQVSRHPWGEDIACLKCLFPHAPAEKSEESASRATGLNPERALQMQSEVTEDDVKAAPDEKREWLRTRVGKTVCSVIQEGMTQSLSMESQRDGFEPSVPFVACLSASMMVTELVRAVSAWETLPETRYQFDVLQGPAFGLGVQLNRRPLCVCTSRHQNIERVRAGRQ